MFVSDNLVSTVKRYFLERLKPFFSESEIYHMFRLSLRKRLKLSDADLILSDKIRLSESDLLFFRSIVYRLCACEPFQYIHGETYFYDLPILTDRRALIPRPETEELVHWILESHPNFYTNSPTFIDIGTGSGCIALALKKKVPSSIVYGFDNSAKALELAKENAHILQLNINFLLLDILNSSIDVVDRSVDLIVSNPPYISQDELQEMKPHVLDHEPHQALFVSNETPIIFYEKIAKQAKQKLKKNGMLYFEINIKFEKNIKNYLSKLGFNSIELKQDMQGKNRMLRASL